MSGPRVASGSLVKTQGSLSNAPLHGGIKAREKHAAINRLVLFSRVIVFGLVCSTLLFDSVLQEIE